MVDTSKVAMSLLFVGLDGSGKTTLLRTLSKNLSHEILPTAGLEIHYISMDNFTAPVLVYDCSGQGRHRENWKTFHEYVDGIGFVIDLDDDDRLQFVKRALEDTIKDEQVQKKQLPIYLFLNKSDLLNRMEYQTVKQYLDFDNLKKKSKGAISWKEVSAFNFNEKELQECFQWLKDNRLNNKKFL